MNWKYYNPKFEYEGRFDDSGWPWAGHKAFAYDLMRNIQPKKLVELGTHRGTSFFSFCQAAKDGNLDTKIYAVDTWEGDKHAGFYGEEIFEEVKEIKKKYYGSVKAELLRKTFGEAAKDFEDKSIDILHIDGLHTYEAVKYDFEKWFDKVKDDGIILFHDIKVNAKDFGIYRLWEELEKKYASIGFFHSFGLGVLFKSQKSSLEILEKKEEWQMHYSYIHEMVKSESIQEKSQKIELKEDLLRQKENAIVQKDAQISHLEELNRIKTKQLFEIRSSLRWKIPNFIYKIYKNKLKKFIPRFSSTWRGRFLSIWIKWLTGNFIQTTVSNWMSRKSKN
jgi:hypothetical protein